MSIFNLTISEVETALEPVLLPLDSQAGPYWSNGMTGEVGELLEVVLSCVELAKSAGKVANITKKIDRDGETAELKDQLSNEAGDVLFYLIQVLHKHDCSLMDAAVREMNKLDKMNKRGSIH